MANKQKMEDSEILTTLLLTFSTLLVLPAAKMPRCAAALLVAPWTIALLTGALCAPKPLNSNCIEVELLLANSTREPDGYFLPDGTQCYTKVPDECKAYARENPRACSERRLLLGEFGERLRFVIGTALQIPPPPSPPPAPPSPPPAPPPIEVQCKTASNPTFCEEQLRAYDRLPDCTPYGRLQRGQQRNIIQRNPGNTCRCSRNPYEPIQLIDWDLDSNIKNVSVECELRPPGRYRSNCVVTSGQDRGLRSFVMGTMQGRYVVGCEHFGGYAHYLDSVP